VRTKQGHSALSLRAKVRALPILFLMDHVQLHFTQNDRDLLRDTSADVKRILTGMEAHNADDNARFAAIDKRLSAVEIWKTRIVAIAGAIGIAVGFLAKVWAR
jgi:hypothetical protein